MNILEEICHHKRKEVNELKKEKKLSFNDEVNKKKEAISDILKKNNKNHYNIITEIKRKSPSAGLIRKDFNLIDIAKNYIKAGAVCLSILTEKKYFGGDINFIKELKENTAIPILRKDFIIDEYQIYESKVFQADAILLIVSILSDDELKKFIDIAKNLNLDCIIEIHDKEEIERALKLNYPIIGINNRNLKNLNTNIKNSANLFANISKDYTVIAESGIKSHYDIKMYNELGIYNFLIGESILRSNDYYTFIKSNH